MLIKSTDNALGITLGEQLHGHWKLFNVSTTETDASDNIRLIESGRIDFDLKPKSHKLLVGQISVCPKFHAVMLSSL